MSTTSPVAAPAVQRVVLPDHPTSAQEDRYIMTVGRKVATVAADAVLVCVLAGLATQALSVSAGKMRVAIPMLVLLYPLAFYVSGLYELHVRGSARKIVNRVVLSSAIVAGTAAAVSYTFPGLRMPLWLLLVVLGAVGVAYPFWVQLLHLVMHSSVPPLRVAVYGAGPAADALVHVLNGSRSHQVVAVCAEHEQPWAAILGGFRVVSRCRDLIRQRPDQIVVAVTEPLSQETLDALLEARTHGIPVCDIIEPYEALTGRVPVNHLTKEWVAFASGFLPIRAFDAKVKRLLDIAVSAVLLLLFLPIGVLVALAVRLSSPGPIFHRQQRVGANSRVFEILKFRTMRADAESATGAVWATRNDNRITPLGRFLRLSRLDEFPQLVNVLRGDMSLVGPRPERPEFVRLLAERIPYYELRHLVKPGITGWAQVCFPYGASVEDARIKLEYDLYYVRHRTPLFDVRVMAKTISVLLFAQGSR
jgi:sugar transferase (PEP-CTERM system associated)